MDKPFWQSMTFWGAAGLAVEAGLIAFQAELPYQWLDVAIPMLATFLTVFGFRRAVGQLKR